MSLLHLKSCWAFPVFVLALNACDRGSANLKQKSRIDTKINNDCIAVVVDPYNTNKEWVAFKEHQQINALHLFIPPGHRSRKYKIKYEAFKDSSKYGEIIFNADQLGSIENSTGTSDSCLHFYGFPKSDSLFVFRFKYQGDYESSISLPIDKRAENIFKWVYMCNSDRTIHLRPGQWTPIWARNPAKKTALRKNVTTAYYLKMYLTTQTGAEQWASGTTSFFRFG
ncbi:MAG: hypothetical protein QM743_00690 [Chitinophagaceae bacterium]